MKKVSYLVIPFLVILSGCFEQANAEPKERIPFGQTKSKPATAVTFDGVYAEGERVLWPKLRMPHDVVAVTVSPGDFEFRLGAPGAELGDWQPISKLTPEVLRGQIFQFAVKEGAFGELKEFPIVFETMLNRFLKIKQVRTRKEWGAKDAKSDMTSDAWKRLFAVHHTAGRAQSDDTTVKEIQLFHMEGKKWSDIGYHFLIGPDGKIFEGRNVKYQGAHVLKHNVESIGINFLGCYDDAECHGPKYPEVAEVTDAMINSMGGLIGALSLHYGIEIDASTVKGHKEFAGAATACPGNRVMNRMNDIRAIAVLERDRLSRVMLNQDHEEL